VLSQLKKYHPSGNLKFNNLGIFQSLKLRNLMGKFLQISLKLNFTPNALGWYGLNKDSQLLVYTFRLVANQTNTFILRNLKRPLIVIKMLQYPSRHHSIIELTPPPALPSLRSNYTAVCRYPGLSPPPQHPPASPTWTSARVSNKGSLELICDNRMLLCRKPFIQRNRRRVSSSICHTQLGDYSKRKRRSPLNIRFAQHSLKL